MKRLVVLAVVVLAGCPKPTSGGGDAAPATSSSIVPETSATPPPAPKGPSSYAGKYSAEPATLYIPTEKDWAHTKQAKDDPSKLVGDGTLAFTVDPSGRVEGTIDSGPASPALIHGSLEGEAFSATVRRKDPADEGLYGTLTGTVKGKSIEGVLKLSDARAALLREAKFTAEKK
jgi:hypothetical protein